MARIVDLKAKFAERAERDLQARLGVDRALLRINALNVAIEAMWDEGSDNAEIAATLRWAADELQK